MSTGVRVARPVTFAARSWNALGSYVEVVVADARRLEPACAAIAGLLSRIDATCSRFRTDSDLVRANRWAGRRVRVDPLLARAVLAAVGAAVRTEGLVDPLLGRRLVELGYDRDLALVPGVRGSGEHPVADVGPAALPVRPARSPASRWREIEVDPEGALLVPAGTALDLGATGKAFAADLIAAEVPGAVGVDLVVSLGGDVAVGRRAGSPAGAPEPPAEWLVEITERRGVADAACETVGIADGGVATSSTLTRRWRHAGRTVHHVIDPRTGQPALPVWRTVTVAAVSCVAANTASTAAVVLGADAESWLTESDLPARLVRADGRVVRVGGWPEPTP